MANEARAVGRKQVVDWFTGLSFEVQQSVLDDFGKAMEAKAGRIAALEKELASLRGANTPSVATKTRKPYGRNGKAKVIKVSPNKGVKVEPKFRHPETGQTWAGRGINPRWVNEYLKKRGNKLDDLRIKK